MTLFRVLASILSIALIVILAGTFRVSFGNSRRFLEAQLTTHAQDAATFLGLTLSSAVASNDSKTVESLTDSLFDHGYYRRIHVCDVQGDSILDRERPLIVKEVPPWFVRWVPLSASAGNALIMSGWRQAGRVSVETHPGHAYAELWQNFSGILIWFSAVYLAGLFLLLILLHFLLNPLQTVEKMALDIGRREFPVMEKLPWSRELRRVVQAMNRMSGKLRTSFEENEASIEVLRNHAYRDPVTQTANRSAFESRLSHLLQSPDEFSTGALYLLHIDNFHSYNREHGHTAGDHLLHEAACHIDKACRRNGCNYLLARLTGAQFGIFLESVSEDEADWFAAVLLDSLTPLSRFVESASPLVFHCGVAIGFVGESFSELMSRTDNALRGAKDRDHSGWHRMPEAEPSGSAVLKANDLRELLKKRLEKREVLFDLIPVFNIPELTMMHKEVLARIVDDQETPMPAQMFVHVAEQMACISDLDRLIVEAVLAKMDENSKSPENYAVNLSTRSLQDPAFLDWLIGILKELPNHSQRMAFEIREFDYTADISSLEIPLGRIAATRALIGIDRFGSGNRPFGYLMKLKPAYLKIDGNYLDHISDHTGNQFFVRSVATIAHGLDIQVIATHVEKKEDAALLQQLGVDAIQGRDLDFSGRH